MKYTLKKKFHPNQVEEIGHVFESIRTICYSIAIDEDREHTYQIPPHEIALLIHAGFLEIYDELFFSNEPTPFGSKESPAHKLKITEKIEDKLPNNHIECSVKGCGKCSPIHFTPEQKIDLSEHQFKHLLSKYNAEILNKFQDEYLMEKGTGCEKILFPVLEKAIESFTKESAEEALRLLKEQHNIES